MQQPDVVVHLRQMRRNKGLTLYDLEHASGVSKSLLQRVEVARADLSLRRLYRIAVALAIPPCVLVMYPHWPCTCACHTRPEDLADAR